MGYTIWPDGYVGEALQDIHRERDRQRDLKEAGKFKYEPSDLELSHDQRYTILGEEFGEVGHELNEGIVKTIDKKKLRKELVEVAAVAVAWIEAIDKGA